MSYNLREDFYKRFNLQPTTASKPLPSVAKAISPEPKSPEPEPEEEGPIDLIVSTPPPVLTVEKKIPTPDDWAAHTVSNSINIPVKAPTKRRVLTEPVLLNNKQYRSNGTANWGAIRKAVYPLYRDFCVSENRIPSITEFTKLIGPRWKELSPEEKCKAVVDPAAYFTF